MSFSRSSLIVFCFIFNCLVCAGAPKHIVFPSPESRYCKLPSGQRGYCKELKDCPPVHRDVTKGQRPYHCQFRGTVPIVCCPLTVDLLSSNSSHVSTRIGEVSPPRTNFQCGERGEPTPSLSTFHFAVSGGSTSFNHAWPWMVLLGRPNVSYPHQFFCSGVIINEHYVITAAHCLLDPEPYFVRIGEHDYTPSTTDFEDTEDVGVSVQTFHPKFDLFQGYHDMALLRLDTKIKFRKEARPICLPWGNLLKEELEGENVTIAGWGRLGFGDEPSPILQEVTVRVFPPSNCARSYSTLNDYEDLYPQGLNAQNIVCAGHEDGVKDACDGDSGGPMMHYNGRDGTYSLAGIISKGFGCGQKEFPGLYAPLRNTDTLEWVKDVAFQE